MQMPRKDTNVERYDRQLRLWSDHGQYSIEAAKVCLIRSGALGSEVLKNLVLPGIGSFTVIDNNSVQEEDLGCSFFVDADHVNRSRAQAITENLCELNEAVIGNYIDEDVADLIEKDPDFFLGFSVIIVTDARESIWTRLSNLLQDSNIPLVIAVTLGVIGYLRISVNEHVIIESHPDVSKPDLRLDCPPAGLVAMANEKKLEDMSSGELAHTPWLIILHLFVQSFQNTYGHFPKSHSDKTELKRLIAKAGNELLHQLREREPHLEASFVLDSFKDACAAVNVAVYPTEIPQEVREIMEDDRCSSEAGSAPVECTDARGVISRQTSRGHLSTALSTQTFWNLVTALRDFVHNEGNGQLPIPGNLPDMTSDSSRYLRLLGIYRDQTGWAVDRIAARLRQFPDISKQVIQLFVKNAAFLRVIRCRPLEEELRTSPVKSTVEYPQDNDAMLWYLAFRAACRFLTETGRWPGSSRPYTTPVVAADTKRQRLGGDQTSSVDQEWPTEQSAPATTAASVVVESDLPALRTHLDCVLRSFGFTSSPGGLKHLHELFRFGGGEIHTVAAFMGGVVAQEIIKLITHQFIPVAKPLIYNAITQRIDLLHL